MITGVFYITTISLACISVFVFAYSLTFVTTSKTELTNTRNKLKLLSGVNNKQIKINTECSGLAYRVLYYMFRLSFNSKVSVQTKFITYKFTKESKFSTKTERLCKKAGKLEFLTKQIFVETQVRLSILISLSGLLLGLVLSNMLGLILFILGVIVGFYAPYWALNEESTLRVQRLEASLPEMLEVVSLALRSGLSFDMSLQLYAEHFKNILSKSCTVAINKWTSGIQTREDALKDMASSFDSAQFKRIIENIVRSLRFGTSLASSLEEAAVETQTLYKAKREEQVAKAPVKMMIPTGTLILPAMLILVLGPVLLELTSNF